MAQRLAPGPRRSSKGGPRISPSGNSSCLSKSHGPGDIKKFGLDPDYVDRLYRSTAGQAFVGWFDLRPDEFRESFRLEEDFQTPPDGATSPGPKCSQIIEDPTPVDDPIEQWLQNQNPTEPTPDE
jgi:hypothetical protein